MDRRHRLQGEEFPQRDLLVSGNSVTATILLTDLGNPSSFDWVASSTEYWTGRSDKPNYHDWAPNAGHGSMPPGTIAVSTSIVIQTITTDDIAQLGSITFDETAYMKLPTNLTVNSGTHKILATPPPAYEFDHWQGTSSTFGKVVVSDSLARSTTVIIEGCEINCFLTAWFRPSSTSVTRTVQTTAQTETTAASPSPQMVGFITQYALLSIGGITIVVAALATVGLTRRRRFGLRQTTVERETPKRPGSEASHEPEDSVRARYVEYLAKLENLKSRGEISEETYLKLKKEFWEKLEQGTG